MTINSWETVIVRGDRVTADLLVWRRYRREAPGIVEQMMDGNPDIARAHRFGPFLPVGMEVRIPIDRDVLSGTPAFGKAISLYPPER